MSRLSVDDSQEKEERLVKSEGISLKRKGNSLEAIVGHLLSPPAPAPSEENL